MKSLSIAFVILCSLIYNLSIAQQDVNQYDANGKRNGKWIGYHDGTKNIRYEGEFKNGKETGAFRYYDNTKSKQLVATREFKEGDTVFFAVFYSGKNKVSEGMMLGKDKIGEWRYFHKNSSVLMMLEYYKNGVLHGVKKVFYPTGELVDEMNYENGLKQGINKKYNKNGILLEESIFVKGELDGPVSYYNNKGQIAVKGQYKKDKSIGIWTYYENGIEVKKVSKDIPKRERPIKKKQG